MADISVTDFGGINSYTNPANTKDGNVIHCVNLDHSPVGGLSKRHGYSTYLGTPDNGTVNTLNSWTKNDGTTLFTYRASGSSLYYSTQGTGAWTLATNGTVANGAHVAFASQDNTLMIADGVGSTRHTTNGTSFTDTVGAPIATDLIPYQGRMWALGTGSSAFYSTTGTITDWSTDSSSIFVPGGGKLLKGFVASDRLIFTKNSLLMFRWDGDSLVDMATRLGPSSPYAIGEVEDFRFWPNRLGLFASLGGKPQLISNPIQNQFYNDDATGIAGTTFDTMPGGVFRYDYYASIGTVTDSLVKEQITNAVLKYDYKNNEFVNFKYANFPTAYHSFKDVNGVDQFIFGDAAGQVYQLDTTTSDNGSAIEVNTQLVFHGDAPFIDKGWKFIEFLTNPGCEAKVQVAASNTYEPYAKKWVEIGNLSGGFSQFRIPTEVSRGRFLFVRIYESGSDSPFFLYGINISFDPYRK